MIVESFSSHYPWTQLQIRPNQSTSSLRSTDQIGDTAKMEDLIVAQYLWQRRADGRYVPTVRVQVAGHQGRTETLVITDPEGRTYRDLNRALEMDHWLLNRWRWKHAPGLEVVITPA